MTSLRVVVASDSFKGTMTARQASDAIASGWLTARPHDTVDCHPMADGGEGTLDIVREASPGSSIVNVGDVTGPDGNPTPSHYLAMDDSTALVELAVSSGIPLMNPLDALGATTRGLGDTIKAAMADGMSHIIVALGGSASTDAGIGALQGLGLVALTADGGVLPPGGGQLHRIASWDTTSLLLPPGGVTMLRDTTAVFLDAPPMFGPQKGASNADVSFLAEAFRHVLSLTADTTAHRAAGSGAAGGCGWGLAHFLGGRFDDGALAIATLTGLDTRLGDADIVITAEGRFDRTSVTGKVTGAVINLAQNAGCRVGVIAGMVDDTDAIVLPSASLVDEADCVEEAMRDPRRYAAMAAHALAKRMAPGRS